jgi:cobalt-zinc-cadmium efflux system outer membrane protein
MREFVAKMLYSYIAPVLVLTLVSGCTNTGHEPVPPQLFMYDTSHGEYSWPKFQREAADQQETTPETSEAPAVVVGEPKAEKPVATSETKTAETQPSPATGQKATLAEGGASAETPKPAASAAAGPLSLYDIIQECIHNNLTIRAAKEGITQAQSDLWTSSLFPNPSFTGDTVLQSFRSITPKNPAGPPQYDAMLNYPIDWFIFGKRSKAIEVSKRAIDVAYADFADQVRQRVADTISAYYDVLDAQAQLRLAHEDLEELKHVEEMTKKRAQIGGVGTIEIDRTKLSINDAERTVLNLKNSLRQAKVTLLALLFRPASAPDLELKEDIEVAQTVVPPKLEELIKIAAENRPDIASLQHQIEKADADIQNQKAQAYPQLSLGGGYTLQDQRSIGLAWTPEFGANMTVSLPISDRNQGNIKKAQSTATQARITFQAQLKQLYADVEKALADLETAIVSVEINDKAQVEAAGKVREKINAAYNLGGRTLLDVLDAEHAYRDAVRARTAGLISYWRAIYKLNAAVGTEAVPTGLKREKP